MNISALIVVALATPIIVRVAYLCAVGSRQKAVSPVRYTLFFAGYALLAAMAAFVALDAITGHLQSMPTYGFLLASDLLIFFKSGSEPKAIAIAIRLETEGLLDAVTAELEKLKNKAVP
jgi:hypothetical protein